MKHLRIKITYTKEVHLELCEFTSRYLSCKLLKNCKNCSKLCKNFLDNFQTKWADFMVKSMEKKKKNCNNTFNRAIHFLSNHSPSWFIGLSLQVHISDAERKDSLLMNKKRRRLILHNKAPIWNEASQVCILFTCITLRY